jgi:hypothetical protein
MVKKINKNHENRVTIMVKVTDQWFPNFPNSMVEVSAMILHDGLTVRVCVWGADDHGMERDVLCSSGGEARRLFRKSVDYIEKLKEIEPINQEFLTSEGFRLA